MCSLGADGGNNRIVTLRAACLMVRVCWSASGPLTSALRGPAAHADEFHRQHLAGLVVVIVVVIPLIILIGFT
jgi:hypothetical protein